MYDAARNRGHLSLASWEVLERYSTHLANERLKQSIPPQAWEKLAWHREQGHRLVLVTATVAPMAEAMADVLGMDAVYGCGPQVRDGILSGSERGWSVPRRKGKVPVVMADAEANGHDLSKCYGYPETPSQTRGSWPCAGIQLPSVQKDHCRTTLKPTTGPLWIGLREFIYPHAPRCA